MAERTAHSGEDSRDCLLAVRAVDLAVGEVVPLLVFAMMSRAGHPIPEYQTPSALPLDPRDHSEKQATAER